jgi:hypothetical protein
MKSANYPDDWDGRTGWEFRDDDTYDRACERCRKEKCRTCPDDWDDCGSEKRIARCVVEFGFWREED